MERFSEQKRGFSSSCSKSSRAACKDSLLLSNTRHLLCNSFGLRPGASTLERCQIGLLKDCYGTLQDLLGIPSGESVIKNSNPSAPRRQSPEISVKLKVPGAPSSQSVGNSSKIAGPGSSGNLVGGGGWRLRVQFSGAPRPPES